MGSVWWASNLNIFSSLLASIFLFFTLFIAIDIFTMMLSWAALWVFFGHIQEAESWPKGWEPDIICLRMKIWRESSRKCEIWELQNEERAKILMENLCKVCKLWSVQNVCKYSVTAALLAWPCSNSSCSFLMSSLRSTWLQICLLIYMHPC